MMKYLVTGAAGFIGSHVCHRLLTLGHQVIGLDIINDYYDVKLKYSRLERLTVIDNFTLVKVALEDRDAMAALFAREQFNRVIHLAAQAGVRYSLENPHAYIDSNITGTMTILEGCRHHHIEHLVYASSSSVYGMNSKLPFATGDSVDHPVSLYAATKKSNELMAHTYSHLYHIPTTGLRFFTVYGPWGRPDMALFLFTRAIIEDRPIDVFNHGQMSRDFTYIDDIVEGIIRVQDEVPRPNPSWQQALATPGDSSAPYRIFNIGNNQPVALMTFIETIELALDKKAKINMMGMQPGDVVATYADIDDLQQLTGFSPATDLTTGINSFISWYRQYYNV